MDKFKLEDKVKLIDNGEHYPSMFLNRIGKITAINKRNGRTVIYLDFAGDWWDFYEEELEKK